MNSRGEKTTRKKMKIAFDDCNVFFFQNLLRGFHLLKLWTLAQCAGVGKSA